MPNQEPTNAAIMEKLGRIEAKFDGQLKSILEQVQTTNGRVTKLERWKDKLDIIADYTKENSHGEVIVDWQKIVLYILGIVASLIALISWIVKK